MHVVVRPPRHPQPSADLERGFDPPFVRRTVVSYLAYIANLPLSCVFCSSASPHAEPGVFDVTTTQSGWWWREHAAQAA